MTADEFRRFALSLPGATESAHMGHPDFRVNGRIFATLQYPDEHWGMVKLSPEQQQNFTGAHPDAFTPVKGGWGRQGSTSVRLDAVPPPVLEQALHAAWQLAGKPSKSRKPRLLKSARAGVSPPAASR